MVKTNKLKVSESPDALYRPDLRGKHRVERITMFGYVSPTDGTRISRDFDHTIGALRPSSENEVPTNTCSIRVTSQHKRLH